VVQVSNNNPNSKYVIERIWTNGYTNGVQDLINNVTLGNVTLGDTAFTAFYSYAGIRAGAIYSGVSANTDLAGQCTLGTNCVNIPFTQTYNSKPICTCSDTNSTPAACNVQVTLGPPTTLTLVGSGTHTLNYICVGRN